jgi:hypothetical protein
MSLRTISYGGGVQSTALVLLAINGTIDFDVALFANVGDDSEHPATLTWVRETMMPLAEEHNFPIHELRKTRRDGSVAPSLMETVLEHDDPTTLREPFPIRGMNGAPLSRSCTRDWKIRVIGKWLKANGATRSNPATVAIGISTDEIHRASGKTTEIHEVPVYPLLDLGWNRGDCINYIRDQLGKVPPKSSCFFCPFHRPDTWSEMARHEPELFEKSVRLERLLNERRSRLGKDPVWLTRFNRPLDVAIGPQQDNLPGLDFDYGDDGCDSGACFT